VREQFVQLLRNLRHQFDNLPTDCQKAIVAELAMRFADHSPNGQNAVGYFKGMQLDGSDPKALIDALIARAGTNVAQNLDGLEGQLQNTQMLCAIYSLLEKFDEAIAARAGAGGGSEITLLVLTTARNQIFGGGFAERVLEFSSAAHKDSFVEKVHKFSSAVRNTPMFTEYNMAAVDKEITKRILAAYFPQGTGRDGGRHNALKTAIEKQFGEMRKAESKVGPRGRGARIPNHKDLQRANDTALRFVAEDTYTEGNAEQGTEESRAAIAAKLRTKTLEKFRSVSEEYAVPPGAPYFEMTSQARLNFFENPLKWVNAIWSQIGLPLLPARAQEEVRLRNAILAIVVPPSGKKISETLVRGIPPRLTSRTTFSKLIDDAGLRTLCGPSGTTTDILAVLHAQSPDVIEKALQQMRNYVEYGQQPDLELKNLFKTITFYMQLGQYHSYGEVGAAIFAAAYRNDCNDEAEFVRRFERLLVGMKEKPQDFLA
jgi:hypothetical protein